MKALITLCLRRPVAVTAIYVLLMALAVVAFLRLPVALLPDLRYPGLVVWTSYPDVPPERVERAVTEPVEEAVAGTDGLVRVTSRTLLGGSLVRLDFGWNADLDLALLNVRQQIDRLGDVLPQAAERPVVLQIDPSDRPILLIALRTATADMTRAEDVLLREDLVGLKQVGREVVVRRLEQLRDVARVRITGGFERRIEILVDPARLAAYDLGMEQIARALRAANVALPGGMIRRGPFRYAVEVSGEFEQVDDVAATVVSGIGQPLVRLRDVAEVREGVEERRGLVRLDQAETLLLLIERRPDANTVRAAEDVRRVLDDLNAELPGIRLEVVVDESVFVRQAIGGVAQAALLGALLAVVVLFVFLRRPRALVAVAAAVPLSLGLTLVLFDVLGVTFNLISLSGLALGVGLLVDNAIVVVENIARLREEGQAPREASLNGTAEVAGAIAASTLTTVAVFLPLTFVEGLAGRLFSDQSLAVVTSLAASLLVALTAVPLLAARDRHAGTGGPAGMRFRKAGLMHRYERVLIGCLTHRRRVLAGCFVLLGATTLIAVRLPREIVPRTDLGRVTVRLSLPPDADLSLLSARAAALEETFLSTGLALHVLADLGERDEARLDLDPRPPYQGDLLLLLPPELAVAEARSRLHALDLSADVSLEVRPEPTRLEALLTPDGADLLIDLVSDDRRDAETIVERVLAQLRMRPELIDVQRAEAASVPAYRLTFRRDNLHRFGVSPATLSAYLEAGARGWQATELRTVDETVPIVLRSRHIDSIDALLAEWIPTREGLLPLSTFVEATFVELPAGLYRVEQAPIVRLTAGVAPGADLGAAVQAVEEVFAATLSGGVRGRVGGSADTLREGLRAVGLSLLLSVLLVYLILAAQFESLVQPLVVLAAVPLAAAGVVLVLLLTGQSINLMSLTGCVVLVGLVVNDAIVKVDFINRRRAAGFSVREAIVQAGRDRLRPILMTTLTTVLGLLPLALGLGEGAELRAPLAIALAGGLTGATLLTLLVVPVLYQTVAREAGPLP
ncbi:acriflavin resistance protein [Rhodothermaceae bacterium RA]|nr:acriflavin resistance protein [Rhodothermaceae bacterium RA]